MQSVTGGVPRGRSISCHPALISGYQPAEELRVQRGMRHITARPLTVPSPSTENTDSRLLQSCPESPGGSRGRQETFQCVHYRVST
jgi:hypothetical protein